MKKIFLTVITFSLLLPSCSKFVDGLETSPNDPTTVTLDLLLTSTEVITFNNYSGQLARMSSILVQQSSGIDLQFAQFEGYSIGEDDNVNEWGGVYQGMLNAKTLADKAGDASPHYRGVARILIALNLGIATDIWGDVPYSEALMGLEGADHFNPHFDSQQSIYTSLQSLLDQALVDLNQVDSDFAPGADDVAFGGDLNQWVITAHLLKARFYNHLSNRDAAGSATSALQSISNAESAGLARGFACNAVFGTNGNEWNQWYAFQNVRLGYMKMGATMVNMMLNTNDPRVDEYMNPDQGGGYSGSVVGSGDVTTSDIGAFFASQDSPAPMVSYVEGMFIKAEASLRSGNTQGAADAFNEAVRAHVELVTGGTAPAFEAAVASETAGSISWDKIMTQKYVASFTQIESWADWRRTGLPVLTANPNGFVNGIPLRLVTPRPERNYNANAVVESDLLKPVWWD